MTRWWMMVLTATALAAAGALRAQEEPPPTCEEELEQLRDRVAQLEQRLEERRPGAPPAVEGYGRTRWGMSREEVRALYPSLQPRKGALVEQARVAGRPAAVTFRFGETGLDRVEIRFSEKPAAPSQYLDDFSALRVLLSEKYGRPDEETIEWSGGEASDPGAAVAAGDLEMEAEWLRDPTRLRLRLERAGGRPVLEVVYEQAPQEPAPTPEETEALLERL